MKNSAKVLFLGAALALWATTLTARSQDRSSAEKPVAVSLVEISDMAIVESTAFSAPFECDTTASAEDMLAAAREMFLADNYELAELLYKCLLRRDPSHLSGILELSVVYESMGRLHYAKGLITRAEILKPDDPAIAERSADLSRKLASTLRNEVDSLVTSGAFEAALPKLSMLLASHPDDPELYYEKARCYLALRDPAGALYEIDNAIRLANDPRFTALQSEALVLSASRGIGALEIEARGLLETGRKADRDRALAVLGEILSRDPDHKWARKQFLALTNGGAGGRSDAGAVAGANGSAPAGKGFGERTAAFAAFAGRVAAEAARAVRRWPETYLSLLAAVIGLFLVFRSPLTSYIARGIEPRHVLAGKLGPIDINAVFSIIHAQGGRGVLHVRSGPIRGQVYFVDGEIYHCRVGKFEGREAVRRLLAQTRDGYFILTKLPRSYKKTIDVPFSLVLMDVGEKSFLESPSARSEELDSPAPKKSRMKSLLENKS
jgi:tetratricopeptide (TPR) repeat protein